MVEKLSVEEARMEMMYQAAKGSYVTVEKKVYKGLKMFGIYLSSEVLKPEDLKKFVYAYCEYPWVKTREVGGRLFVYKWDLFLALKWHRIWTR